MKDKKIIDAIENIELSKEAKDRILDSILANSTFDSEVPSTTGHKTFYAFRKSFKYALSTIVLLILFALTIYSSKNKNLIQKDLYTSDYNDDGSLYEANYNNLYFKIIDIYESSSNTILFLKTNDKALSSKIVLFDENNVSIDVPYYIKRYDDSKDNSNLNSDMHFTTLLFIDHSEFDGDAILISTFDASITPFKLELTRGNDKYVNYNCNYEFKELVIKELNLYQDMLFITFDNVIGTEYLTKEYELLLKNGIILNDANNRPISNVLSVTDDSIDAISLISTNKYKLKFSLSNKVNPEDVSYIILGDKVLDVKH